MRTFTKRAVALTAALALTAAACGGDDDDATDPPATDPPTATEPDSPADTSDTGDDAECAEPTSVKLQLQWFTQAQFAGYYAAIDQGYYADQCLDVEILQGAVDIQPHVVLADGGADFAISWVSKALAGREAGADITNIAQVFQRSGTLQVAWADSGISSVADFAGKKIGNWGFGNEYEIFAALGQAGLDPGSDVELVAQSFDMQGLLNREIDAAEAMTYNEYAQLLEAVNPDTGELYQPEDFTVISYAEIGAGMLQDAIWAHQSRLDSDPAYKDTAVRFVAASLQGWSFCKDNVQQCADITTAAGSTLGTSHQLWMMNEINKLIWPSPEGAGYIVQADWDQTVELSQNTPNLEGTTVLTAAPTDGAYTNDIVEAAWELIGGNHADAAYTPIDVVLAEGGN
ncbi:MAG TPA: ABC transporter substrate-binding protein [Ilumatobacter sp.]|nr:ABC transporter substrate-binding protein [Ilumatobacter sp.]